MEQGIISLTDNQARVSMLEPLFEIIILLPTVYLFRPRSLQVDFLFGKMGTHSKCAGATFWVSLFITHKSYVLYGSISQ
jgi:hypothetical protein